MVMCRSRSPVQCRRVHGGVPQREEIVVELAALQGKGYPAPADLDTGGAPLPKTTPLAKAKPTPAPAAGQGEKKEAAAKSR